MSGFSNTPKIIKGAFVEYGLSIPPLFVVFQFNPLQVQRNRNLRFRYSSREDEETGSLRQFHKQESDLLKVQERQQVQVGEENINFQLRLDATDKLNEGDAITQGFGILPQLSTLELMVHPKEEGVLGQALGALLGSSGGFSFTRKPNPPLVLLIWGLKRVLPVNITGINIAETEFNPNLDPIRATVDVTLTVIEGANSLYTYSKAAKEVASVLNLANMGDIANVVIPG